MHSSGARDLDAAADAHHEDRQQDAEQDGGDAPPVADECSATDLSCRQAEVYVESLSGLSMPSGYDATVQSYACRQLRSVAEISLCLYSTAREISMLPPMPTMRIGSRTTVQSYADKNRSERGLAATARITATPTVSSAVLTIRLST
jgi:hypothetical protein